MPSLELSCFLQFRHDLAGERAEIVQMPGADAEYDIPVDRPIGVNSRVSKTHRLAHDNSGMVIDNRQIGQRTKGPRHWIGQQDVPITYYVHTDIHTSLNRTFKIDGDNVLPVKIGFQFFCCWRSLFRTQNLYNQKPPQTRERHPYSEVRVNPVEHQ